MLRRILKLSLKVFCQHFSSNDFWKDIEIIETDSKFMFDSINDATNFPWTIAKRLSLVTEASKNYSFCHVYRDENLTVDALSNYGHSLDYCKILNSYYSMSILLL